MSRLPDLCSDAARQILRLTIEEAQGNEVFFLGTTDETGVLQEVDPLARGNDSAVPALLQVASAGDVILHNHPSGRLVPSEADLELAAHYGNQGVGFYIVNNAVDDVYVVVEAFAKPVSPTLEVSEILQLFAPGGALAKRFRDYQHRPAQERMAKAVAETFNHSRVALIEAATGTGKSLAYLIPAILWAVRNRQRVVVSTNTINLQEQLIHKDIPLLQQVLDREFNAVLVKGRSNYLCLDKLQALDRQGKLFLDDESADFTALSQWARQTSDGSRSDLSLNVSSALWEKVACESDTCTRIKCEHYSRCFFYKARRQAAAADLLVVNHHLLFADLAVRRATGRYHDAAVLPPWSRLILDEAHNVEDIATEYFGVQVSKLSLPPAAGAFSTRSQNGGPSARKEPYPYCWPDSAPWESKSIPLCRIASRSTSEAACCRNWSRPRFCPKGSSTTAPPGSRPAAANPPRKGKSASPMISTGRKTGRTLSWPESTSSCRPPRSSTATCGRWIGCWPTFRRKLERPSNDRESS